MNLSHTLFTTISNKLKLKVSLLNEEKLYVQNLKIQIDSLKKIKENDSKSVSIQKNQMRLDNNQDFA